MSCPYHDYIPKEVEGLYMCCMVYEKGLDKWKDRYPGLYLDWIKKRGY